MTRGDVYGCDMGLLVCKNCSSLSLLIDFPNHFLPCFKKKYFLRNILVQVLPIYSRFQIQIITSFKSHFYTNILRSNQIKCFRCKGDSYYLFSKFNVFLLQPSHNSLEWLFFFHDFIPCSIGSRLCRRIRECFYRDI